MTASPSEADAERFVLDEPPADMGREGAYDVQEAREKKADAAAGGLRHPHKIVTATASGEGINKMEGNDSALSNDYETKLPAETEAANKSPSLTSAQNAAPKDEKTSASMVGTTAELPSSSSAFAPNNATLSPPAVPHVTLPKKAKDGATTDVIIGLPQQPPCPATEAKVTATATTAAMPDALPKIESDDAAVTATPVQSIAQLGITTARCSSSNGGEEKKMEDEDNDEVPEKDQRRGDPISAGVGVATPSSIGRHLPPPATPISNIRVGAAAAAEPSPLNSTSSTPSPQSETTDTTKAKSTPTMGGNSTSDGRTLDAIMAADNMADTTTEQKMDGLKLLLSVLKNLSDPELTIDPVHHKIPYECQDWPGAILQACPFVRDYLTERIGFKPLAKGGESFLCLFDSDDEGSYAAVEESILQCALLEVQCALAKIGHEKAEMEMEMEQPTPIPLKENESTEETADTVTPSELAQENECKLPASPIVSDNINAKVAESTVPEDSRKKTGDDENEAEAEHITAMVGVGVAGNDSMIHHTVTQVDNYVGCLLQPGASRKKADCAHFDTVAVNGYTALGAYVYVNRGYLIVPDGTDSGMGAVGIPHGEINIHAFRSANARFIDGADDSKGGEAPEFYELGIIIETEKNGTIRFEFDGFDPEVKVNGDERTAQETLCQFAQRFVSFHEFWSKKNSDKAKEKAEHEQQQTHSTTTVTTVETSNPIDLTSYQPPSGREGLLNEFVSIVSEEAPTLVHMVLAWTEGHCSHDELICSVASLLRSQQDINRFNELLGPNGYSIVSRYGTSDRGAPLFVYRGPNGMVTTDRKAQEFLLDFQEARSQGQELDFLETFMYPLPEDYHWMKGSDLFKMVECCMACKDFDTATGILQCVDSVINGQDTFDGAGDVFGPIYNLRGQIYLQQAKDLIFPSEKNPFDQYRCGPLKSIFDDETAEEEGDVQKLLDDARDWLQTAQHTTGAIMPSPMPEFHEQDESERVVLQDLCTLTMRIGKTYELNGDIPQAIKSFEEALGLLHLVRPASSSRIVTAHLDLGDLCAMTLIPSERGVWSGDDDNMGKAVAHYLSSARSIAIYLATESGRMDPGSLIGPGTNTYLQVMETLNDQNGWGERINIGKWACHELSDMMELLKSADVTRFGKPWLVASHRINLIRERLREMARHPMYHNEIGALNKSKRDREEYQRSPLQFTLNEGDSHMENSEPSFGDHYSHEHGNGRASKICKMGDYGDIEPDLTIGKPGGYNEVSEFPDFAALGPMESI